MLYCNNSTTQCLHMFHQDKLNAQVRLQHINYHCGNGYILNFSLDYKRKVIIHLICRLKLTIPPVNPVYYDNIQTSCHFESTAEIHFLWIKSRILRFVIKQFFSLSLDVRNPEAFLIVSYLLSNHSAHANWIFTCWVTLNFKICIIAFTKFFIMIKIFKRG